MMEESLTPDRAHALVRAYDARADDLLCDVEAPVLRVLQHPVLKGVYLALTQVDAFILEGPLDEERVEVTCASDGVNMDDPGFLEVTIRPDGTWRYPDEQSLSDDEASAWRCYERGEGPGYRPTGFAPGETVYPLYFHPNVPGGWTVVNADRSIQEYFQAE